MKSSFKHKGIDIDIVKEKSGEGYGAFEKLTGARIPGCWNIVKQSSVQNVVIAQLSKRSKKDIQQGVELLLKKQAFKKWLFSEETDTEFKYYFGQNVSVKQFIDTRLMVIGYCTIDIIAFDLWLGTPDGISTNDYIIKEYGQKACDFVKKLMDS